jgi:DNA polymerase-3 subunit epsilon
VRGGEEEAKQAEENYEKARAQTDRDYEETAAAVAEKKALTAEEEAELNRPWRKLVKLYHPDRFAHEPDKLATYEKLIAAINRAKEAGDIKRCAKSPKTRRASSCGRAGRDWISATRWNWRSCGGCMRRCN